MQLYDRITPQVLSCNLLTLNEGQGQSSWYKTVEFTHVYSRSLTEISSKAAKRKPMLMYSL